MEGWELLVANLTPINFSPPFFPVRFVVLSNNYLQIRGIKKSDEGMYRCEGRILARGEVDFRDIRIIVNGEHLALDGT